MRNAWMAPGPVRFRIAQEACVAEYRSVGEDGDDNDDESASTTTIVVTNHDMTTTTTTQLQTTPTTKLGLLQQQAVQPFGYTFTFFPFTPCRGR